MYKVEVDVHKANKILKRKGLEDSGPAQRFFTNEVMRLSDRYVPMANGVLKNSAKMTDDGKGIIYNTPYARYHWYGKLMVDPLTGKGCFVYTDKTTGNVVKYSRPGVQKVLTDRDMKYNEAPLRGPKWVERCWIDNRRHITKSLKKYVKRGCK